MEKPQLIAYYLPQFYEIEFNNKYWGPGHTEWTSMANAKPLFKGHYQPHVPADLGFYNLLMPEAREKQAKMAQEYGIDGFCYWHYWFGNGKVIMEKPVEAVLSSGKPDFPFCFSWANHSWHNPKTKEIILPQEYFGDSDHIAHFEYLLPYFKDPRYIKVEGKPLFSIFIPVEIPELDHFLELWNDLACSAGLGGIYFVGIAQTDHIANVYKKSKLDAINVVRLQDFRNHKLTWRRRLSGWMHKLDIVQYSEAAQYFIGEDDKDERFIPSIITGWDHSPRTGRNGLVLDNYTPDAFGRHVDDVMKLLATKSNKLCFVKSWNEWGEGNYLEPDLKWGKAFLEKLKEIRSRYDQK